MVSELYYKEDKSFIYERYRPNIVFSCTERYNLKLAFFAQLFFDLFCQVKASKSLKLSFTPNFDLKRGNDLKAISN